MNRVAHFVGYRMHAPATSNMYASTMCFMMPNQITLYSFIPCDILYDFIHIHVSHFKTFSLLSFPQIYY